jgi:hypothetical protein
MHRNDLHHTLTGFVILLAIVGCALPGQITQHPLDTNSNPLGTTVAGTAQVSANQTEQPDLVTSTPIIAPTEALPSPAVISSYATSLVKLEDGSTQFKDYKAGVQIIFPSNWMPIRVGESEYYKASEKWGTQNPWFLEEIGWIQTLDVNVFRVNAYDTQPEHLFYSTFPKINVVFQQGDTRTLKQVEADEKSMIENSVKSEHKFLSSDFQETSGGLPILVFQSQWKAQSYDTTHYTGTFFQVPAGLVFIDFYIPSDHKDAVEPQRAQIVESITLFTP